ncbi:MAG TPA: universal stress protein [Solirubrobacteraceae bacterium]|nr:universal stress protein [Solirubrobacteraceae bacterium]
MAGPVLFCYDGSEGSRAAMAAAGELVAHPAPAVVLTIWQPASVLLARAGGFGGSYLGDEAAVDQEQAQLAADAAEEGVERARDHGFEASSRVEQAREGAGRRIVEIADELDARLIVCGRRGLGAVASALLGSVSHVVLAHAGRPVLIAPER